MLVPTPPAVGVKVLHSLCCTHRSYGGVGGLLYLLLHPAHLEMFPEINHNLRGDCSSAIGGEGEK